MPNIQQFSNPRAANGNNAPAAAAVAAAGPQQSLSLSSAFRSLWVPARRFGSFCSTYLSGSVSDSHLGASVCSTYPSGSVSGSHLNALFVLFVLPAGRCGTYLCGRVWNLPLRTGLELTSAYRCGTYLCAAVWNLPLRTGLELTSAQRCWNLPLRTAVELTSAPSLNYRCGAYLCRPVWNLPLQSGCWYLALLKVMLGPKGRAFSRARVQALGFRL